MFCQQCGTSLEQDQAFCPKCGAKSEPANAPLQNTAPMHTAAVKRNSKSDFTFSYRSIIFLILALVVLTVFFYGAYKIGEGAHDLTRLRSQSGTSVAEAYYQYHGMVYSGFAMVFRGMGVFCAAILVWLGIKKEN